ncbi:MAG TPA: YheC/YheD family protein [Bacillales bacterium]|nr:YheC/YheD family protein [Bacillales bacterium]
MTPLVKLQKVNNRSNTVFLPDRLRDAVPRTLSWIGFSTRNTPCRIHYDSGSELGISEDVWEALRLPLEEYVHVYVRGDTLQLGPLIGIFTAGFTDHPQRPVGERTRLFAKTLSAASEVGAFCYLFGSHQIDWGTGTIEGYFYHPTGWEKRKVPFPDVVYDRLPNRRTERLPLMRSVKHKLQNDYWIPWFNPGFFDKWDIHEKLRGDARVVHYLPETQAAPDEATIAAMLSAHRQVYVKPAKGSLGLGIHQIIRSKDGEQYFCRFHDGGENRLRRFHSLNNLLAHQFPGNRLKHLLAQQGIELMRDEDRVVDFRVHTNKNDYGDWQVSALAAKVAGSGSVTTHLKYGGRVKTIDEVLRPVDKAREAETILKEAALTISQAIDENIEGFIGEIGFDLGIDINGKVWLFEANAKPGRHIFAHPKLKEAEALSRRLPLAYAVHLTETQLRQPAMIYA